MCRVGPGEDGNHRRRQVCLQAGGVWSHWGAKAVSRDSQLSLHKVYELLGMTETSAPVRLPTILEATLQARQVAVSYLQLLSEAILPRVLIPQITEA